MKQKFYLGLFLAIVALSAFFIVRSFPSIFANPLDHDFGVELLTNNDFASEGEYIPYAWNRLSSGIGPSPSIKGDALSFGLSSEAKANDYRVISQETKLRQEKYYAIKIEFSSPQVAQGENFKLETGFFDTNVASEKIFSETVENFEGSFETGFAPTEAHSYSHFFLQASGGEGEVLIRSISVKEFENPTVSIPELQESPTPEATITDSSTPQQSATPTSTPTSTPTPSPTPTASATETPEARLNPSKTSKISLAPRWNIVGFPFKIDTTDFTSKGMVVFKIVDGVWRMASADENSSNYTILSQNAVYVFNPLDETTSITVVESLREEDSEVISLGWNILYNSGEETNIDDYKVSLSTKNDQKIEKSLKDLIDKKLSSAESYYLVQTEKGVGLQKNNFRETPKIKAESAFWFYIFELPS